MSVINKMLRDLDARRSGALPELQRQAGAGLLQGTASVAGLAARRSWRLLVLVLLLAAVATGAWLLTREAALPATPPVPPAAAVVAPVPAPAPVASQPQIVVPAPPVAVAAPAPVASSPAVAAVNAPPSRPVPAGVARRAEAVTPAPSPARPALPAAAAVRGAPGGASPGTHGPGAADAPGPERSAGPMPAQRRQAAARETLAQAQALWTQGSRESALDLLREALQLAEHSAPQDTAVLALLAREQARFELALGRPAAALALLTRLEPALAGQADLWAVRGNAAQRLGRHAESVQAYQQALRLRPDEPRWLLGAAVSMAAQGQPDAAAQQVERARALGPVSPEVLDYLRQTGVPLR